MQVQLRVGMMVQVGLGAHVFSVLFQLSCRCSSRNMEAMLGS